MRATDTTCLHHTDGPHVCGPEIRFHRVTQLKMLLTDGVRVCRQHAVAITRLALCIHACKHLGPAGTAPARQPWGLWKWPSARVRRCVDIQHCPALLDAIMPDSSRQLCLDIACLGVASQITASDVLADAADTSRSLILFAAWSILQKSWQHWASSTSFACRFPVRLSAVG